MRFTRAQPRGSAFQRTAINAIVIFASLGGVLIPNLRPDALKALYRSKCGRDRSNCVRPLYSYFSQKLKEFYWTVTRALGLGFLHHEHKRKIYLSGFFQTTFYPVYVIGARLLHRAGVRFIDAQFEGAPYGIIEHIGHCAMDFDTYLKDQILSHRRVIPVFLGAGRKPANEALIAYWGQHIYFVRSHLAEWLLRPFMSFPKLVDTTEGYSAVRGTAARMYELQARWGNRAPLLRLTEADLARGEAQLRSLGVPEGSWFVCVHSREGGYIPNAEWQHSFRNSNIADYAQAMQAIVERGGWCIRVGDPTMQPLKPMPGVIDYAHSPLKCDWMDVFLCARCHFFLGNTSGLFGLAAVFGRPSALANMVPLSCSYSCFPGDLSIPKLLTDTQGRIIPWPDAFADEASDFRHAPEFAERELTHIDNTPQEIAELAVEMLDRLDGRIVDEPEDADLQARFLSFIQPHHYCWGTSSHIGRMFLRRHRALLMGDGSAMDRVEKVG